MAERYPARKRAPSKRKLEHEEDEEVSEGSDEHSDSFIKPKLMSTYYNFPELLESKDFEHDGVVQTMSADDFTTDYIKDTGLRVPLIFHDSPEKLGMRMPPADEFTVRDVMNQVGEDRRIEVVQVDEQSGKAMVMKDFVDYYEKPEEERGPLLNVLSLEFSATQLAETVKPPSFVHELDWVEKYWPDELKQRQKISVEVHGDDCDFSTYPKVQRYCLMSVKGCYTDFHMDFGGTSVWYHVLKGEKIFWIVEPTETNIFLYEEWLKTNGHNEAFFGKAAERCTRVRVHAGDTFIIPSCWIHSVYTPQDSLVFGGNFLHSYAIPGQIRAAQSEDKIRISGKYRYPYFKQMLWYYMEHIVRGATGRVYRKAIAVDPRGKATLENLAAPSGVEEHRHVLRGGLEPEDDEDVLPSEPTVYYDDPKGDDWINVSVLLIGLTTAT
ncbi:jmjC domain containing protein [Aphelenchoides avenae]|nr:jmjC domain containing protein [Aphelenchus avenae]